MRKFIIPILLLLGLVSSAFFTPPGPPPPAPNGGFVGPCDQGVACPDGWGAERLTSAYTGKLINVCNTDVSHCGDVGFDTSGGASVTDLAAITNGSGTPCSGDSQCRLAKIYSQFGGCTLVPFNSGTYAQMAAIHMTTTENGHVVLFFDGDDPDFYLCQEGLNVASATLIVIATPNQETTQDGSCGGTNFGNTIAMIDNLNSIGTCPLGFQGGTSGSSSTLYAIVTDSGDTQHNSTGTLNPSGLFCGYSQGSASTVQAFLNGTGDTAGSAPGSVISGTNYVKLGGSDPRFAGYKGEINAFIAMTPGISNTNANTVEHVMGAFWASSNPC